ncbi:CHRD domain-containing protein [Aeoliella sp. ICT_H6.2]|uniref:CHRD domain-containing protein n=1 Tax=Aeoliella straminimaris TaxID=2954799 RepID=A0A9X2FEF5_9BACT|nr:CHRD domain-containing protein [Aeoliella straminimaris]MCO6047540.1 CHRD domain-containing protein [Aeoliella straminimaris]
MKCTKIRSAFLLVVLPLCVLVCVSGSESARAEIIGTADLSGAQEVPPNASNATGYATMDLDPESGIFDLTLVVEGLTVADLAEVGPNDSPVHIHLAPEGVNGGVVVDLGFQGVLYDGVDNFLLLVDGGTFGGPQGGINSDIETNIDALLSGHLYINVHTDAIPGGEIRGQISATDLTVPEPTSGVLGMIVLVSVAGLRFIVWRG